MDFDRTEGKSVDRRRGLQDEFLDDKHAQECLVIPPGCRLIASLRSLEPLHEYQGVGIWERSRPNPRGKSVFGPQGDAKQRSHFGTRLSPLGTWSETFMTTPIPADIWFTVAQFLQDNELRALSTVNLAFFAAAIDARYQTVVLRVSRLVSEVGLEGLLLRLRNPTIAGRVRHLCIDFGADPPEPKDPSIVDAMLSSVPCLGEVTSLRVTCNWNGSNTVAFNPKAFPGSQPRLTLSSFVLPVLHALSKACYKPLCVLHISANPDTLYMMVQHLTAFHSLDELNLHIDTRSSGPTTIRFQDLGSLLGKRFPHIKRLSLSAAPRLDISFLFNALGRLSSLEVFNLTLSSRMRQMELKRLVRFINNNPSIHTFNLDGKRNTLLLPEDFCGFVDSLSQTTSNNGTSIYSLRLPITVLTPHIVHALATRFPSLRSLILVVGTISGDFVVDDFYGELRKYNFARWVQEVTVVSPDGIIDVKASLAIAEGSSPLCRIENQSQDAVRRYLDAGGCSHLACGSLKQLMGTLA